MDLEKYMFPCISKTFFGIDCLGCGFQRAFLLLLEGDFEAAFAIYPAIYSNLIFLFCVGLHFLNRKQNYKKLLAFLAVINAVFMIGGYYYTHFVC